ncbi:hypothetical protein [Acinetobacter sp. CFCC 10889]|uniref:hypothetical protein n=1 Tax=Acinetobacter sp. CFCC 10889 TaxID=1775557 RepID=UPI000DCF6965|nr:hypothetical protein [Acinetobacter sp. CFCC 10889]
MKFLYIYLVIHLLCFGILLATHGAFLQPYLSQLNQKEYTELLHQRITQIALAEHFKTTQCQSDQKALIVATASNIFAILPEKSSVFHTDQQTVMDVEIREIGDDENYTRAKAQYYADILNQNLQNFKLKHPVCVETLAHFPKNLAAQSHQIEYFNLTLTQEQKIPMQKEGLVKAFLIDFIFAPVILIVGLFLKIVGFSIP